MSGLMKEAPPRPPTLLALMQPSSFVDVFLGYEPDGAAPTRGEARRPTGTMLRLAREPSIVRLEAVAERRPLSVHEVRELGPSTISDVRRSVSG
jgi:hypothetical protein